jgi:hypothetical protein
MPDISERTYQDNESQQVTQTTAKTTVRNQRKIFMEREWRLTSRAQAQPPGGQAPNAMMMLKFHGLVKTGSAVAVACSALLASFLRFRIRCPANSQYDISTVHPANHKWLIQPVDAVVYRHRN